MLIVMLIRFLVKNEGMLIAVVVSLFLVFGGSHAGNFARAIQMVVVLATSLGQSKTRESSRIAVAINMPSFSARIAINIEINMDQHGSTWINMESDAK